jgi:outer membrane protein TolC
MKRAILLALTGMLALPISSQPTMVTSLTLAQAENLAVVNSGALRIRRLTVQSSARRFTLGIRDYLPQVELGFTTANSANIGAEDSLSDELSISLREQVYNGGRTAMQRSLSRLEIVLAQHSLEAAKEDILNDVWDKYHQSLVLMAQRDVKRDALSQSRDQLEIALKERELGMIREVDLVDVQLSVSGQEIDLQSLENDLEQALYDMKKSIGLEPDVNIALDGTIDSQYAGILIDKPASHFFSIARQKNQDLQSALYRVTQLEAQLSLARSQYLPQVSATVSLAVSGAGFPLQTPSLNIGLEISFPQAVAPIKGAASGGKTGPFSTARNTSLTASPLQSITGFLDEVEAGLKLEEARAAAGDLTRDLDFQIGRIIAAYRRQDATIGLGRDALDLERKKLRIVGQQVAAGSATRADLLKEQTQAANQEVALLSDILQLIRSERSLERLIGIEPGGLPRLVGGGNGAP